MKLSLLLAIMLAALLSGCANHTFPVGPNPLDLPGDECATVEELHTGNMIEITGNPAYR